VIYELAEQENQIVQEFIDNNQALIRNTEEIIGLLENIAEIHNRKAMPFYLLNAQVHSSLSLCLLSTLRDHQVQAQLMLRFSLEAACLAAYSLHHTQIENFIVTDSIGAKPVPEIKHKVYKWLKQSYQAESEHLHRVKKQINEYYAHGNLFASLLTIDKQTHVNNYFDRADELIKQSHIWELGNIACLVFSLIYKTLQNSPIAKSRKDSFEQFEPLLAENQRYRNEFLKNERLAKWLLK
jgi:hypothetical protein